MTPETLLAAGYKKISDSLNPIASATGIGPAISAASGMNSAHAISSPSRTGFSRQSATTLIDRSSLPRFSSSGGDRRSTPTSYGRAKVLSTLRRSMPIYGPGCATVTMRAARMRSADIHRPTSPWPPRNRPCSLQSRPCLHTRHRRRLRHASGARQLVGGADLWGGVQGAGCDVGGGGAMTNVVQFPEVVPHTRGSLLTCPRFFRPV